MKTVVRLGRKSNKRLAFSKHDLAKMSLDSRAEVIQALIPLGLMVVGEELQREVTALVGKRYHHTGGSRSYYRWGKQVHWARNMLHSLGGEAACKFIGSDIGFGGSKSWFVMPSMSA